MIDHDNGDSLVIYCYKQISDRTEFSDLLKKKFRQSGHERELEFRFWDCYKELPGQDGDIYIYDGMVLSTLADQGYIRRLPDIIDTGNVFEWVRSGSMVNKQIFGFPFLLCTDVLIRRKSESVPFCQLGKGQLSAPMKSMLVEYYIFSYFNSPDKEEGSLSALQRLLELIGGREVYERSRFDQYDGVERFIRGESKYLLGFTEDLRLLPPDDYIVQPANISDSHYVDFPFYYVNYISVGPGPAEERLLDCLDLIEILTGREFFMEYCKGDGKLKYLIPADRTFYSELIELDDIYRQLYEMVRNEENCVLRYGKRFYEEYPAKFAELHDILNS